MQECQSGNLISRTGCILTYDGSTRDIVINYVVLGVDVIMCYVVFLAWRDQHKKRIPALLSLIFLIAFQVVICWVVACAGISLIWCAILGWMLHEQRQPTIEFQGIRKWAATALHVLIIPLNVGVIIYYALVSPFLTTVAHFCAMVLGVLLSKSNMNRPIPDSQQQQRQQTTGINVDPIGVAAATNATPLVDTTTNNAMQKNGLQMD